MTVKVITDGTPAIFVQSSKESRRQVTEVIENG